ncbi:MAG: four helix bundle protein, partial [Chloroflexota bacterium]|nr:four helix bundle protein [Chloroflexota bacterium]
VTLNIAEGYGRYHYLDSLRFYYFARGSLEETLSAFILCNEIGYTTNRLSAQRNLCGNAVRTLNGYIRYVRKQKRGIQEYGKRSIREDDAFYDAEISSDEDESPDLPIY